MRLIERALLTFALAVAFSVQAETSISNVTVNQRWPWSEEVDVDFILSGDASDVDITATWDSQAEPVLLGSIESCQPGQRRFTWNPLQSAYAGKTLTGFAVSVTNSTHEARCYLVLDLVDGGVSYLAAEPAGGWSAEHKSSKMVFRRIPKGTYSLGITTDDLAPLISSGNPGTYSERWNKRSVTFTNDFYVAIFKYTEAQHAALTSGEASRNYRAKKMSYYELRGAPYDVDWPNTGYTVLADSVVGKLRAKAGGLVVDLCEEEQWEVAARAGTTTIWPNGGTASDSAETLKALVDSLGAWYGNAGVAAPGYPVGCYEPNGWGLYDVVGICEEWTLDTAGKILRNTVQNGLPDSTNPTGISNSAGRDAWRVIRGSSGYWVDAELYNMVMAQRWMGDANYGSYATRFCIHLSPLGNLTFPSAE